MLPEIERNAGARLGRIEQQPVEADSGDGVDFLVGARPVAQKFRAAVAMMHEPAAHRHQQRLDEIEDLRLPQRIDAARREREVDRAARLGVDDTRVGVTFVHGRFEALPRQHDRQQAAALPGADDLDVAVHGEPRRAAKTASRRSANS